MDVFVSVCQCAGVYVPMGRWMFSGPGVMCKGSGSAAKVNRISLCELGKFVCACVYVCVCVRVRALPADYGCAWQMRMCALREGDGEHQ